MGASTQTHMDSVRQRQYSKRPNVVLFISDQQRADTIPGVRLAGLQTPHLDWLAQRAILCRRAYTTAPLCSPARAALLSGLYPHTNGMVANHQARPIVEQMRLSPDVRLIADYLGTQGYACAYMGKWHLGTGGDRRGFLDLVSRGGDHDVDGPAQNDVLRFAQRTGYLLSDKQRGYDPDPAAYDTRTHVGAALLPLAWHASTLHAGQAVTFIHQQEHDDRPFLT